MWEAIFRPFLHSVLKCQLSACCVHWPGHWGVEREQASPSCTCMLTVACVGRVGLQRDTCNTVPYDGRNPGDCGSMEKGPWLSWGGDRRSSGEVTSTGHGGVGQE